MYKTINKGDKLAMAAPSGPMERAEVYAAKKLVEKLGFQCEIMPNVLKGSFLSYLSAKDFERASDLNLAFARPDIDGVIALRGGYGASRILSMIDYKSIKENPKPLIGYSDITALSLALFERCGVKTIHSFMPGIAARDGLDLFSKISFYRALRGESGEVDNPTSLPLSFKGKGKARGRLIGGNLSVLTSLCGTEFFPDTKGAILFLEEVNEPVYKIDRLMRQLEMCGVFDNASGFVLGGFTDVDSERDLNNIFNDYIFSTEKPAVINVSSGHTPVKTALIIGGEYSVDSDSNRFAFYSGENSL